MGRVRPYGIWLGEIKSGCRIIVFGKLEMAKKLDSGSMHGSRNPNWKTNIEKILNKS
jgi:hypothetical protein